MATSFSSTTPLRSIFQNLPIVPKALLSAHSSFTIKRSSTYVTLKLSGSGRHSLSKGLLTLHTRKGFVRAATIEEIEAEKASIENDVKSRMERTLDNVKTNFSSIRTGRATPSMLDKIEVEYYGSPVSLKTIAQISTPDASSLLVSPYDKSSLKAIEKAIVNSDVGMTPNNDGEVIRLSIPQLTSDRRKELTKIVSKQVEEGKVALRNIRRDALKAYEKLEKDKKLSEDNVKDLSSDLQKLTDDYIKKVDALYKQKEKELLTV
ncbi:putative ribosome recycling factor [Medicago truncatula]|uniref:Ribosome-recycling factor, chloroplastic n=1 Tax=Medicago truncatula TaxID=3880 RepID=B7FI72_MEDTR|nr:ribosome-recycling factor, chloroplastic [Medicago truncatula]ACJ84451.1 unknown [Medicago truncatula]ACJ84751.1 unknown [Medicago truncatula]AES60890.1 ribosome recycling factor [Medicago truncatula]RHN80184.1 putative ribosome recycling factor [Medicago truncatula]